MQITDYPHINALANEWKHEKKYTTKSSQFDERCPVCSNQSEAKCGVMARITVRVFSFDWRKVKRNSKFSLMKPIPAFKQVSLIIIEMEINENGCRVCKRMCVYEAELLL